MDVFFDDRGDRRAADDRAATAFDDYDGDGVMIGRMLLIAMALFAVWTLI